MCSYVFIRHFSFLSLFSFHKHLSRLQIVIQKQSLTCESKIEIGYYNPKASEERLLKTDNICVHCGCTGCTDFLFGLEQLQEKNMTDGWPMLPICDACMKACQEKWQARPSTATERSCCQVTGSTCKLII